MRTSVIAAVCIAAVLPVAACSSGETKAQPSKSSASSPPVASVAGETLLLGKSAETVGAGGGGRLELTPTSVVHATKTKTDKPEHGLFVIVTVKVRPTTDAAAAETAPLQRGGWSWLTPDGQAVGPGDGTAADVFLDGFDSGGPIQAGASKWRTKTFDISTAQRGGTLTYTDGAAHTFRWKIPAEDTGPQTAQLKKLTTG
ncbi:hypothetical protein [Streptomyces sp. ISL-11]|uniref:hypothetical protein n=1 Tax=Streptomyces sp. ISL-11 TaxID=2819174 RepID=UPI001BE54013|nr:hypothetical protein [Streptomyces sp. ISL-11]MBT2386817.1 hypothetical protein [Streptomyces sp. ISL-11]